MTPHACAAGDGPAELIMIFDRDGQRAHVHRESVGERPSTTAEVGERRSADGQRRRSR
jgi:hypothetical protein